MLKCFDPSKGIEPLNHALGTCLSNRLAGVPVYACLTLYLLEASAVGLVEAQQRFSVATMHLSWNLNRYRFRCTLIVHGL